MSPKSKKQFEEIRESSKENILNVALKLFSSKGYFNTSTRQIAERAKISNGLLYNYFKSKEELLTEIIHRSFKILDNTIVSDKEQSAEIQIISTIERFFELIDKKQNVIRMMAQMGLQTGKFDFINKMISKKYIGEVNKLKTALKKIDSNFDEAEANLLMATLDGIMFQVLVMGDVIPTDLMRSALIMKYSKTKHI
ncbi:TetR family transcriptional regulator [Hyunsoonleella sp. SJ7]|uniref:TetR family transcriptional regulator n=1 Tax=Hyunsoonleella aquatilis TaxID=2762758 RepID=A0A923H9J1_9FLAO|nr:TetR family transcriptional regulator [Hyunsoonleella aquatilis]MBC3757512.1 TetR family transcriptional regulator [Hyunsoonleella aquatilis]